MKLIIIGRVVGNGLCALMNAAGVLLLNSSSFLSSFVVTTVTGGSRGRPLAVVSVKLTIFQIILYNNVQVIAETEIVMMVNALQIVRKIVHPLPLHPLRPLQLLQFQQVQQLQFQQVQQVQQAPLEAVEVSMEVLCNL